MKKRRYVYEVIVSHHDNVVGSYFFSSRKAAARFADRQQLGSDCTINQWNLYNENDI